MCHNSDLQSAQIEKFVAHGMPQKIVKTVEYTLRKRAAEHKRQTQSSEPLCLPALDNDCDDEEQSLPILSNSCTCNINACSTEATSTAATETAKETNKTTIAVKQQPPVPTKILKHPAHISKFKIPKLCERLSQLQNNTEKELMQNLNGDIDSYSNNSSGGTSAKFVAEVYVDVLAVSTQLTKQFTERFNSAVKKLQSSKICTLLTKTSQPAHIIAICILSFVLLTVAPDIIESSTTTPASARDAVASTKTDARKHTTLVAIAYLGAFATHFGTQIWMTFVSGLSLYFSLPRHTFGQCQQILFPKYFALNSMLSIAMLILFVKYFLNCWSLSACVQMTSLAVTAFIEVAVRLYLAPPMLRLMHEKYRIEAAIGSGQEVGTLAQGDLVQCPHYQRIHKSFRRIHMTVAIGNMAVLLTTCLQLYFLASKIQIT